jgi:hypothetical protein
MAGKLETYRVEMSDGESYTLNVRGSAVRVLASDGPLSLTLDDAQTLRGFNAGLEYREPDGGRFNKITLTNERTGPNVVLLYIGDGSVSDSRLVLVDGTSVTLETGSVVDLAPGATVNIANNASIRQSRPRVADVQVIAADVNQRKQVVPARPGRDSVLLNSRTDTSEMMVHFNMSDSQFRGIIVEPLGSIKLDYEGEIYFEFRGGTGGAVQATEFYF